MEKGEKRKRRKYKNSISIHENYLHSVPGVKLAF